MLGDGGTVCGGTIALVMSPFVGGVTWVALREVDHQPVSGHFGDDRRGGDGGAMLVAFDFWSLCRLESGTSGASNVLSALVM